MHYVKMLLKINILCDFKSRRLHFFIHHKNKQPVILQQKRDRNRNLKGKEVMNLDSDNEENKEEEDDEFETVKAEKKRHIKK